MKVDFYLTANSNGTLKLNKQKPASKYDEVVIAVKLELPDSLFKKPQLSASIKVDEDTVRPFIIDANAVSGITEAIKTQTGLDCNITIEDNIPAEQKRFVFAEKGEFIYYVDIQEGKVFKEDKGNGEAVEIKV